MLNNTARRSLHANRLTHSLLLTLALSACGGGGGTSSNTNSSGGSAVSSTPSSSSTSSSAVSSSSTSAISSAPASSSSSAASTGIALLAGNLASLGNLNGNTSSARLYSPFQITQDSSGNLYVADTNNSLIRKVTPTGVVTTLAGTGSSGTSDGSGTTASFNGPRGIAVASDGSVYVGDGGNNTLRKITTTGLVSTVVGVAGSSGTTDANGTSARLNTPQGMHFDSSGNLYFADTNNHAIRKMDASGTITTVAGNKGSSGAADGLGSAATFKTPADVAVDTSGNLYVADAGNHTIRKIDTSGNVTTLAGSAGTAGTTDGLGSSARFNTPRGLAVDSSGNVYVADSSNHAIRKIDSSGNVSTYAGSKGNASTGNTDGSLSSALFNTPTGIMIDSSGNLLISESYNGTGGTIRKITPAGVVSTWIGEAITTGTTDASGNAARFNVPIGVALDGGGNLFVADRLNHLIRKISSAGNVTTFAGTAGTAAELDGSGTAAQFNNPAGVTFDPNGNLYVTDTSAHTIRKITPTGVVSTFAGSAGSSGNTDGTGSTAKFNAPYGIVSDNSGNLYVADRSNHLIRKITPAGIVTTLAGTAGSAGSSDGSGTAAKFNNPMGITIDSSNNLYVVERGNHTLRKIAPDGLVSTLAGSAGISGNTDGSGSAARFNLPQGIAVDAQGTLYVSEIGNNLIRKVTSAGVVTTLVGSAGSVGVTLGGLPGSLYQPQSIVIGSKKADGSAQSLIVSTANGVVTITLP